MRAAGVRAAHRLRLRVTTDARHAPPVAPNALARRVGIDRVGAADRVWAGDVAYIAAREGWPYLAVVLDLASAGWSAGACGTPSSGASRTTH